MKNMELLNICYKFFNHFITVDTLIEKLSNIDKSKLSEEDIEQTNKIVNELKKIAQNNPNTVDEFVLKKKESINSLIKKLDNFPDNSDESVLLTNQINNLKKEYGQEIDAHERWLAIASYLNDNEYFNKTFDSLTDYELLEYIAQSIQAPFPPSLTQAKFDKLVKVGIDNDEREWLWRLAFNYEYTKLHLEEIADYFIKQKDGYYLAELISAVGSRLNIDSIIDKISDKDLIKELIKRKDVISFNLSDGEIDRLIKKGELEGNQ